MDDLGAVLVIALFYSGNLNVMLLVYALLILAFLYTLSYKGIYSKFLLIFLGGVVWLLFLKAGIHPTLAGILLAFSVPIRQRVLADQGIY
ncbi:MAG: Na+/H+ antiporter NhaA [Flavobacteriaceae bacterium]